eukprot:GGOE01037466.1.p1 GENE.GGOE01037466.1~~GGOE01037466.1.p1  ORF type:complete len:455 (-),score=96.80 GGOE01037466.1:259-1623(-)
MALLRIQGVRADGLLALDDGPLRFGEPSSDPFCLFRVGTRVAKTAVQSNTVNPLWEDQLQVELPPTAAPRELEVLVFNHNTTMEDEPLGMFTIRLPGPPKVEEVTGRLTKQPKQTVEATGSITFTFSIMYHSGARQGDEADMQLPPCGRYVFADWDNTIVVYATQVLFPGAARFLHELRGDMDDPDVVARSPKVMVLSARADLGPVGDRLFQVLAVDGEGIHGGTLYGNPMADCIAPRLAHLTTSPAVAEDVVCRAFAARKVQNVEEWKVEKWDPNLALPLYFVGDNGEGDVYAAEAMLAKGLIAGAFIRRVTPFDRALFPHKPPCLRAHPGLLYFDHYEQAALLAFEGGLLTAAARDRVVQAFRDGVEEAKRTQSPLRAIPGSPTLSSWLSTPNVLPYEVAEACGGLTGAVGEERVEKVQGSGPVWDGEATAAQPGGGWDCRDSLRACGCTLQ